VLRTLGQPWSASLYGGAMMSQIGEFSFVLVSVGLSAGLITRTDYQLAASVIAVSLAASPLWIAAARRLLPLRRRTAGKSDHARHGGRGRWPRAQWWPAVRLVHSRVWRSLHHPAGGPPPPLRR
jgi:hypothetical protein